ncbi:MAG: hypothetical protein L0H73_18300 [Nitrococcus sp.]|nr:hypothetical protein [Nitrococcus sp.]
MQATTKDLRLRANELLAAVDRGDASARCQLSAVIYMELVQGMRDKPEMRAFHRAFSQ